jgi:hypothetical protein
MDSLVCSRTAVLDGRTPAGRSDGVAALLTLGWLRLPRERFAKQGLSRNTARPTARNAS